MPANKYKQFGYSIIATITIAILTTILLLDPIAQDPAYHQFKDSRIFLAIPNFLNVSSNLAFLFVGLLGIYKILITKSLKINDDFKSAYLLLFTSLILISIGSSYYHLAPDNLSLAWDRLAMAIGFMSLLSIVIYEYISPRAGKFILLPAILLGISSVIYWILTEEHGVGDLRAYILVAFFPVLLTPATLLLFRSNYNSYHGYIWLLLGYLLAKLSEHFDAQIFIATGLISGHSLKHLFAALGFYLLLKYYENRLQQ